MHYYYYIWPFVKKLYHGWVSTMTSSNEILWELPPPEIKSWLRPCLQVTFEINLCACISSALHRCLRETRVEELVCFSFSEVCVKTIWSSRSESCVLTYCFACTLATLGIMLNIAEISHDLIFSRYQLSRFFWDFVFTNDFVWNKAYRLW